MEMRNLKWKKPLMAVALKAVLAVLLLVGIVFSDSIYAQLKEQAENILSALGISASNAINMFYKQIILNRGLPFEVKIPTARPADVSELSEAELNAELEKGYADMKAGRAKPARQAFADIRKDYGI